MSMCDVCAEIGAVNCKHCWYGNPCFGCPDYSEATDTCESHGGCGAKRESALESAEGEKHEDD